MMFYMTFETTRRKKNRQSSVEGSHDRFLKVEEHFSGSRDGLQQLYKPGVGKWLEALDSGGKSSSLCSFCLLSGLKNYFYSLVVFHTQYSQ